MAEGGFDDKPPITKDVCRECKHQLQDFVNFGTLQKQFEKHGIPLYSFDDVRRELKDNNDEIDCMLYFLTKVDNGFQIFYDSLRETQHSCPKHKLAADILKYTATSEADEKHCQLSIYSEKVYIYKGKKSKFIWDEAGISLSLPEAHCEKDVKLSVKIVNDDLHLPSENQGMPLVSALYKITASDKLPVLATVRIQHCAVVDKENTLMFLIAHGKPPYHFTPLLGGKFPLKKCYGEIDLDEFSILIILQNIRHWNMRFAVHIVYCGDGTADFAVTKNISPHVTAVKEEYHHDTKFYTSEMTCSYSTDAIALSIPENPTKGWKVESIFEPPKIPLTQIHEYQPGKIIPRIKLNMKWLGRTQPREESVNIGVKGGSIDSFKLLCKLPSQLQPQPTPPIPSQNVFFRCDKPTLPLLQRFPKQSGGVINIIQEIEGKKHDLGILILNDESGQITATIETQYRPDQTRITKAILQRWLEGTGRTPQSWATLITVLREVDLNVLAKQIKDNLVQEQDPNHGYPHVIFCHVATCAHSLCIVHFCLLC
ncbi:hypothetical protein GBAR_LOCUS9852 [Geodia barretti]|uniref:Death domain-containing protein n=1 Tax=Geodia barretti TaxID=519541 RepID=A0AA35WIU0_GEOBA|nr:hypothetical protein GBAR_LOCUS9852 [Geodia barretti]